MFRFILVFFFIRYGKPFSFVKYLLVTDYFYFDQKEKIVNYFFSIQLKLRELFHKI